MRWTGEERNAWSGTRAAFTGLSDALVAEGYPEMVSISGDRSPEVQEAAFRRVFIPERWPGDRGPYGDRKYWPGHGYWVRMVGGGTVGVPDTSNHEAGRSNDLASPYNYDSAAHRRAKELAPRFGISCEGENFEEKWHWTFWGDRGAKGFTAGGGTVPYTAAQTRKADDMTFLMATSMNDAPNGPFNRWICDSAAGTMRNIDKDEWDFNIKIGVPEPEPGIQPSDRLKKRGYRQI